MKNELTAVLESHSLEIQVQITGTGPAGRDGRDGRDGSDGKDGAPGAEGPPGPQGERGPQGLQGPEGKPGQPGKDAVVDSTLSQAGQAADAAAVGVKLTEMEDDLTQLASRVQTVENELNGVRDAANRITEVVGA